MSKRLFSLIPIVIALSGCSVYMASKRDGVDVSEVQKCNTRTQFLALGAKILNSERCEDGSLVEVYQIPKDKGSAARAVMHGLLDISTFFYWELIGTPMEAVMMKKEFIVIKVTYNKNDVPVKADLV